MLKFDPLRITMLMAVWEGNDICYYFFLSRISYNDYRLAMKGKKDLHFVCARCFAPDNGEEDADDILGAPTLTREVSVNIKNIHVE